MITCCAQDVEDTRSQERGVECLRRRHFASWIALHNTQFRVSLGRSSCWKKELVGRQRDFSITSAKVKIAKLD